MAFHTKKALYLKNCMYRKILKIQDVDSVSYLCVIWNYFISIIIKSLITLYNIFNVSLVVAYDI